MSVFDTPITDENCEFLERVAIIMEGEKCDEARAVEIAKEMMK